MAIWVNTSFALTDKQWMDFCHEMALVYIKAYQDAEPRIRVLLNPPNMPPASTEFINWILENCPHPMIKAGNAGHMYQINAEAGQIKTLRKNLFAKADDDFLRVRSEFGEDAGSAGWRECPAWNMYALLQAALYIGLDIECIEGSKFLADKQYFPAFDFFNRYAGQKDPATSPGAFCALRDGLDASDEKRFPADKFGEVKQGERKPV